MIKNVFNSHLRFQHKIVFIFWRKWMNIFLGFNLVIWYTILQILHIFFFSQQYLFEYQKSMKNSLSLWWYELYGKLYDTYTNANKNNSIINTDSGADYFWRGQKTGDIFFAPSPLNLSLSTNFEWFLKKQWLKMCLILPPLAGVSSVNECKRICPPPRSLTPPLRFYHPL